MIAVVSLRRLALAALLLCLPLAVMAQTPPQQKTQVPGFYRYGLGGMEVTALYDGYIDLETKLLRDIRAEDLQRLMARLFVAHDKGVQTAVNAYLVHTGSNLVLVDAGTAKAFGPTLGFILENIRAAGYDPAAIDTVLLTHLHPDHAMGVLTADGQIAFPNAKVYATEAEAAFWLDPAVAAKQPAETQPFFAMAQQAVKPYRDAGRFQTFKAGAQLLPGVTAVPAAGHTPGHTGYLFASSGKSLLVWGDIVHYHAVQFVKPDVSVEFDTDYKAAVATRKRLLADAAKNRLAVAGAHLPFPGIGHVRADGKGAYAWVPVEYGPLRADR